MRGSTAKCQRQQIFTIFARRGSIIAGSTGVARVGNKLIDRAGPTQLPGQPVMRMTHRGSEIGIAGVVICQPSKLACRERGDRNYTNCVCTSLGSAEPFPQIPPSLPRASLLA